MDDWILATGVAVGPAGAVVGPLALLGAVAGRAAEMLPAVPLGATWPWGIFFGLLGLCVGSFLNVCIHRLPAGKGLVWPGSHCPVCLAPVAWYDNLPVLSYFILRGRCRRCGSRFSVRYMLVEAATGALFFGYWLAYFRLGVRDGADHLAVYGVHMVLASALVVSGVIDYERKEIYTCVTNTALVVGLAAALVWPQVQRVGLSGDDLPPITGWVHTDAAVLGLIGVAVGAAMVYLTRVLATQAFRKEAMGIGDVYLMAAVGGVLGWQAAVVTFFVAPFVGLPYGVAQLLRTKGRGDADQAAGEPDERPPRPPMPWVPFLATVAGMVLLVMAAASGWDTRGRGLLIGSFAALAVACWCAGRRQADAVETVPEPPRAPPSHEVPYGPFLGMAAGIVMLVQDEVVAYFRPGIEAIFFG